ncbi:helix-turn-helix domain-containing protein [Streptomyces sp. NPDC058240]|uniref:helix-turn-helix domain-containing protein n=1 Tax=Streptomyces sp. NPDC058240 TaxID=3346396 RepID=UPI0036E3CC03
MQPLDGHPEWENTLRAYLRHGFDRRATAAHLNLHPNTVDYRLGRIARLCGIDAADPAERLTAFAALYARDRAGYTAIERIGLGLAVTLEFLGPLAVALAGSRRRIDLVAAVAAAGAVAVLTRPTPSTDYLGIGLALLAATCWACYILLNRTVGARLPGLEGSAAAAAVSGTLYLPVGMWVLWHRPPTTAALGCALAAGVLSSVVPFLADLLALRRIPAHFFGVFMSVNPVFAALTGLVVLGQRLDSLAWLAIAVIVGANTAAVSTARRPTTRRSTT